MSARHRSRFVALVCGLALLSTTARAGDRFASPGAWASSYPSHVAHTLRPLGDWQRDLAVGAGVSLAVLAASQADSTLERQVREHGPLGHGLDKFGSDTMPWLLVGGYLAPSLIGGGSRWGDVEAMIEAQAAQGLLIQGLKKAVDRRRPNGNHYAFPSGHCGFAFTSAGLIDGRYGHTAGALAFAGAGYVAATRITLRRHWLSDTVAGAAIGTTIGELVAAEHRRERAVNGGQSAADAPSRVTAGLGTTPTGATAAVVALAF